MNSVFPLAFLVGLLSALHCIGMCGALAGAMSCSLPIETRRSPMRYGLHLLAFNLGRVASYALAGALVAGLGAGLVRLGELPWLEAGFRMLAAAILVGIGCYVGGWLPGFAAIERLGMPVWRRLEPLAQGLLPVTSVPRALLFGAAWGWLPCGLVYSMLLGASAQGGVLQGALYMGLFGLGSLPVVLATGVFAGRLNVWGRDPRLRSLAGGGLVLLAFFSLGYQAYNG